MAKPLVFQLGDQEFPLHLQKIDRTRLYGSKETEALDEHESVCELATLADDGRTMIGKGGTGLGWLDPDGNWCQKAELKPHDLDGNEIQPVKSSFGTAIKLFETATAEELLGHNIRLAYALQFEGPSDSEASATDLKDLLSELKRGTIFKFSYSYRGGLEADAAFLLLSETDELMMLVGQPTEFSFVGIQSQATAPEPDESEDASDSLMDFDMI